MNRSNCRFQPEAKPKEYAHFVIMGPDFSTIKPAIKKCKELVDYCSTTKVRIVKTKTTIITQEELFKTGRD